MGRRRCPAANMTANTTGAIAPIIRIGGRKESKKEKDAKSQKKDLHSVQREDANTKKTPIVRIDESEAGQNNRYHDLDYSSDDGSAMMVQASNSNNKLVTGITVVELPDREGKRHTTTILIDTDFTGYALMSHQLANILDTNSNLSQFNHIAQRKEKWRRKAL